MRASLFLTVEQMKFAIALLAGPQDPAARSALSFAQAVVQRGHAISHLFFYRDAVHLANALAVHPQDEADLHGEWLAFISEHELDAVVCIAASLKRGVLDPREAARWNKPASNTGEPWQLSGLGQWIEALQVADRAVTFGS